MPAMVALLQVIATLGGCFGDRGDKAVVPPVRRYLDAADQTLPPGVVGEPYEAAVLVSGGDPPYTWYVVEKDGLPKGLSLDPKGTITGVPAEAGDFLFALMATDTSGRAKRSNVALEIVLDPRVVSCGDAVDGRFASTAFGVEGPDLTAVDSLEWLAVEVPDDLTTRVELLFASEAISTLYVERPGEVAGSSNLSDHYVPFYLNPGYTDMNVVLDAGTQPSLTGFLTQPIIPMVLVGQSPGRWSMEVVCTDGPIFQQLDQYPTELGLPLLWDYQVYGDNENVRIWTEDPLPDWMVWDETTGTVTGTAMEPGAWEFTLLAETPDGRRREERTILGVFDVNELPCGASVPLDLPEGYFDGEFYAFYDTRGFEVYRIPLEAGSRSEISIRITGSDGHYLGLAGPDPGWLNFYGGAERLYVNDPSVEIDVNPASYPAISHYMETGELYFSAGTIGTDTSMTVSVVCDEGPRPNLAALPVIQPLGETAVTLEAIGGTPPYSWSATGLPNGIVLDDDGTLRGQTGAIGTYAVDLTLADKVGGSFAETYTLYVGDEEACGEDRVMQCGDSIDGEFTSTYYNNNNGHASTRVFCIVDDTDRGLGWEIYSDDGELRVDVADPGATAEDLFDREEGTYVAWVRREGSEGVPIDPFSWPSIDDYENLPVRLAIRAYEPGTWTVHLVCQ